MARLASPAARARSAPSTRRGPLPRRWPPSPVPSPTPSRRGSRTSLIALRPIRRGVRLQAKIQICRLQYMLGLHILHEDHHRQVAAIDLVFLLDEGEGVAAMAAGFILVEMLLQ